MSEEIVAEEVEEIGGDEASLQDLETKEDGAEDSMEWKRHLLHSVEQRNVREVGQFKQLITAYQTLLTKNQSMLHRIFALEQEKTALRQQSLVGSPSTAHLSSGDDAAELKILRKKCHELQDELMSTYRLKAENSNTLLRLKEQSEADQKAVLKAQAVAEENTTLYEQTNTALQRELARAKQLEHTIEVMRQEIAGARKEIETQRAKSTKLEKENRSLVDKVLAVKYEQAEKMNAMNDMYQSMQQQSEMQERQKVRDRKIGEKKALEAEQQGHTSIQREDFSDTQSIIDNAAWRSNFNVSVPTTQTKKKRSHSGSCNSLRYNSSGSLLASTGADSVVRILDSRTFSFRGSLRGAKGGIMSASFSPNDQLVLATGSDKRGYIWSLDQSNKPKQILTGHRSKVYASAFTIDSQCAVTGSHDRTMRLWDLKTNNSDQWSCQSACNYLSLSPNGDLIASAHLDHHVRFWSLRTKELMHDITDLHSQQATSVEFSKDGTQLISHSRDNFLKLIDIRTWKVIRTFTGTQTREYVNGVNWNRACFSPDCQYILAGGIDGSLFVWKTATGELSSIVSPADHSKATRASRADSRGRDLPAAAVTCVAWNSNGRQFVSSDYGGNVVFYGAAEAQADYF